MARLLCTWLKIDLSGAPVIRYIDLGNGTMFCLYLFRTESPYRGTMVAIDRVGAFLFRDSKVSTDYVSEKLRVPKSDAAALADWLNVQNGHYEIQRQQAEYDYVYVSNAPEYYKLIGQDAIEVLKPIIQGEE